MRPALLYSGILKLAAPWALGLVYLAVCNRLVLAQNPLPTSAGRILGVFSAESGKPIVGAEIMDLATHVSARTTVTGTVSLGFIAGSRALLSIRQVGYAQQVLAVSLTAADTTPITVVLESVATLPRVVTHGEASADTIRELVKSGFYERRHIGNAPSEAFVTADQIAKWTPTRLSDIPEYSGYFIHFSQCKFYVNGQLLLTNVKGTTIDDLFQPDEIAGLEMYMHRGGLPIEYRSKAGGSACVVLLWLK